MGAISILGLFVLLVVIPVVLAVRIFGGGALVYVGWRFLARSNKARYWRSVGAYLLASICGGAVIFLATFASVAILGPNLTTPGGSMIPLVLALPLGLLMTWLILKLMCRLSYGKAILAWLPTLAMNGLLLLLALPVAVSTLASVRQQALAVRCKSNLRSIAQASLMWAEDSRLHRGQDEPLTPDMMMLIRLEMIPPGAQKCPGSPQPERVTDYVFLPRDIASVISSRSLIACCYGDCHKGWSRNVARLDGSAQTLTPEQFAVELVRPENAEFAAALRAAEEKAGVYAPAGR